MTYRRRFERAELKFSLKGKKLLGSWALVRTHERQWLLIKHRDFYAADIDVTELAPASIVTRRTLAEIAEDEGGDVKKQPRVIPEEYRKEPASSDVRRVRSPGSGIPGSRLSRAREPSQRQQRWFTRGIGEV